MDKNTIKIKFLFYVKNKHWLKLTTTCQLLTCQHKVLYMCDDILYSEEGKCKICDTSKDKINSSQTTSRNRTIIIDDITLKKIAVPIIQEFKLTNQPFLRFLCHFLFFHSLQKAKGKVNIEHKTTKKHFLGNKLSTWL